MASPLPPSVVVEVRARFEPESLREMAAAFDQVARAHIDMASAAERSAQRLRDLVVELEADR